MLFAERNHHGEIIALHTGKTTPQLDPVSLLDRDVLAFLCSTGELDAFSQLLVLSDTTIVRVLEDLVDLLIEKNLILFTELPEAAQKKLQDRKNLRSQLEDGPIMVDDIL